MVENALSIWFYEIFIQEHPWTHAEGVNIGVTQAAASASD